jgi:hypothetical protein
MAFNIWKPDEARSILMISGEEESGGALKSISSLTILALLICSC